MKKLVCELCRSSNFGKLDGIYICRDCGSKYSLEEARRLLVDTEPEPVSAAEPAPAAPKQIPSDYLALARQAKVSGDDAEALRCYTLLHQADPDNWEASFFTVYYNALLCKLSQIPAAAGSVRTVLSSVMEKILTQLPRELREGAYAEVNLYASKAAEFLYSKARTHYDEMNSYVRSSYSQEMVTRCGASLDILYTLGDLFQGIQQMQPAMLDAWKTAIAMHEKMLPLCADAQTNRDIINSYVQKVGQFDPAFLGAKAQSQRETRRQQIIEEMNSLRRQMDVPPPKGKVGMAVTGVFLLLIGIVFCAMGLSEFDDITITICGFVELIIGTVFLIAGVSGDGGARQNYNRQQEANRARYSALERELNSLR